MFNKIQTHVEAQNTLNDWRSDSLHESWRQPTLLYANRAWL